ncbi:unnamed protein product [Parnassius apollo]|uniref:(apollo) hypothetical protein n=1 Tax=Parnassius apollo TaxID=110799 RepID=A0A8S3Y1F4_PARAO|nr:unnamed protein product [Parnassius apollo]
MKRHERKKKEKAIQQLLIDNSPPNSDNEVHPAKQDPLTQLALSLIPNSYLNRLDYAKASGCPMAALSQQIRFEITVGD